MADVIAMMSLWQMLKPLTFPAYCMADVIANVADGMATAGWVLLWQMLIWVVDGITTRVYFTSISVLGC